MNDKKIFVGKKPADKEPVLDPSRCSLGPTFEHFFGNTVYNAIVNHPKIPLGAAFSAEKIAWLKRVYYAAPVYTPDKTLAQPTSSLGTFPKEDIQNEI